MATQVDLQTVPSRLIRVGSRFIRISEMFTTRHAQGIWGQVLLPLQLRRPNL